MAPEGGEVEHVDRYIWPGVAQVHYRLGEHWIDVWNFLQPLNDSQTYANTSLWKYPQVVQATFAGGEKGRNVGR